MEPRLKWNKIILAENNFISFQTWFRATLEIL